MKWFTFNIPIDVISAITGGLIGLFLVIVYEAFTKPRIYPWNWKIIKEDFNLGFSEDPGENYKIKFKVCGLRSPGFCVVKIIWSGNVVKAKWDDVPNPLRNDNPNEFVAELVPQTYLNTIMLEEFYAVPIFNIDKNNKISIFDGWWFGKRLNMPYGPNPVIDKYIEVKIEIKGNELSWKKKFSVQEIIDFTK